MCNYSRQDWNPPPADPPAASARPTHRPKIGEMGEAELEGIRARYLELLLDGDARGARATIAEALEVATAATVYFEVVQPALYEVGRLWERAHVSVAQEHLATGVSEVMIGELAGRLPRRTPRARTAIVACGGSTCAFRPPAPTTRRSCDVNLE
jgi:methanogenic corrinoid protein MtbC1